MLAMRKSRNEWVSGKSEILTRRRRDASSISDLAMIQFENRFREA